MSYLKRFLAFLLMAIVRAASILVTPFGVKFRDLPRRTRRLLGWRGPIEPMSWRKRLALGLPLLPMKGGATIVGQRSPLYYKKVAGGMPVILDTSKFTGNVFYVDSGAAGKSDATGYGTTPDAPFATIDYAIGICTAGQGDVILVLPGHAETLSAAGAIAADVAGVTIIGLGVGAAKPTLTFSNTAASVLVTAANFKMVGFRITPSVDSVTNPFHVQAAGCELDFEVLETDNAVEFVRAVLTTAAADRLTANIRYMGRSGGDACVNAVRLVGCDGGRIHVDFYGKASTAVVEFLTTACTDIVVTGYMYVSGTVDGSKLVVDTATGSTWWAEVYDGAAGAPFSGGSGSALAKDDLSAVTDALYGANGVGTFPVAAVPANNVSLAEVIRDIWATLQGTAAGENGIQTWPAAAAPANNVSLAEVVRHIVEVLLKPLDSGTAQAGAAGTVTLAATASATNNLYNGAVVQIISGTGAGQSRVITAYVGATKVATIAPNWATNPANDSVYIIHALGTVRVDALTDAVITAASIAADAIGAAEIADAAIDAATFAAGAINAAAIADSAIDRATFAADTGLQTIRSNTAQAGAAGTITFDAAASASNDFYNNTVVLITGGTGVGQARLVTAYVGATKVASVAPNWVTNPDNTSTFAILAVARAAVQSILDGAIAAATFAAGAVDAAAIADNAIDAGAIAAGAITAAKFAAGAIDAAAIANAAIDAATFAAGAIDAAAIADNAIDAGAIAADAIAAAKIAAGAITAAKFAAGAVDATALGADAITNAKIADNALASEQFALSAGEKTTDGVVVTKATAALPQTAAAAIFTVTGLVLLKRIVGYVTVQIGAVANATKLVGNSTGAGASTDLCATLDINGHVVDSRYEITGTFINAMVRTLDVPLALVQAANIVLPPGTIDLNCAGSDGGTGRVRWSATYVPLEAGAQIVAA